MMVVQREPWWVDTMVALKAATMVDLMEPLLADQMAAWKDAMKAVQLEPCSAEQTADSLVVKSVDLKVDQMVVQWVAWSVYSWAGHLNRISMYE